MQKFQNGDEVEVACYNDDTELFDWIKARYVCFDESDKIHVIDIKNEYLSKIDDNIRPAQLICDEAREMIKRKVCDHRHNCTKLTGLDCLEVRDELKELLSNCNSAGCWYMVGDMLYIGNMHDKKHDELNLSTGEVTGGEEKELSVSMELFDEMFDSKSREIEDLNKEIQMRDEFIVVRDEKLKEKDAEIEVLMEFKRNIHSDIINSFDKIDTKFKRMIK
jgi:hypothetical protein